MEDVFNYDAVLSEIQTYQLPDDERMRNVLSHSRGSYALRPLAETQYMRRLTRKTMLPGKMCKVQLKI